MPLHYEGRNFKLATEVSTFIAWDHRCYVLDATHADDLGTNGQYLVRNEDLSMTLSGDGAIIGVAFPL